MSKQNITRLLLDLSTFVALLVVSAPHFTGDAIHEWLALALSGAIVFHLLLNWKWIVEVTSRLFTKSAKNLRFGYFLNWGLFVSGGHDCAFGFDDLENSRAFLWIVPSSKHVLEAAS